KTDACKICPRPAHIIRSLAPWCVFPGSHRLVGHQEGVGKARAAAGYSEGDPHRFGSLGIRVRERVEVAIGGVGADGAAVGHSSSSEQFVINPSVVGATVIGHASRRGGSPAGADKGFDWCFAQWLLDRRQIEVNSRLGLLAAGGEVLLDGGLKS